MSWSSRSRFLRSPSSRRPRRADEFSGCSRGWVLALSFEMGSTLVLLPTLTGQAGAGEACPQRSGPAWSRLGPWPAFSKVLSTPFKYSRRLGAQLFARADWPEVHWELR